MDSTRINSSIDVDMMQRSHVTTVGGTVGLSYDLARCGLGAISLVDYDHVSATNPALRILIQLISLDVRWK